MYIVQPLYPAARCNHTLAGVAVDGDQACAYANVPGGNRVLPKHGHWRIKPNATPKAHRTGTRHAGPMWPANLAPDPSLARAGNRSLRVAVRLAVAAGHIAPADAPSWAQPK